MVNIKKFMNIVLIFTILLTSCYSVTLSIDQTRNLDDYTVIPKGNTYIDTVNGFINNSIEFNNGTLVYYYDYEYEFKSVNENFYIIIQSYTSNETVQVMYRGNLQLDGQFKVQPLQLNEVGAYYLKFEPDYENEPVVVYIDFPTDYVGTVEFVEDKPQTFSILARQFTSWGEEIVNINVTIWRFIFYTFVLLLMLSIGLGLFGLSFLLIKYNEKLKRNQGGGD